MNQKICAACFNAIQISFKQRKYIDIKDDFICSPQCIIRWIMKYSGPYTLRNKLGVYKLNAYSTFSPRSNYENTVAQFLNTNNIQWEYEEYGFYLNANMTQGSISTLSSNCLTYTPDFYLPEHNCFLEVKGIWQVGQKKKMRLFRKQYPNVKLLVISWLLYNKFNKYINALGVIK